MMFKLTKEFRFEAAHKLIGHDGKCARLHGHSWVAKVTVVGSVLIGNGPKRNMLADFGDLKNLVQPVVDEFLDHHYLNETLECDAPTSEYVARWIFRKLQPTFSEFKAKVGKGFTMCDLVSVEVNETCTSSCCYTTEA